MDRYRDCKVTETFAWTVTETAKPFISPPPLLKAGPGPNPEQEVGVLETHKFLQRLEFRISNTPTGPNLEREAAAAAHDISPQTHGPKKL